MAASTGCVLFAGAVLGLVAVGGAAVVDELEENRVDVEQPTGNKTVETLCAAREASACLRLSVARALSRLAGRPGLELMPGLTLRGDSSALEIPRDLAPTQLDDAMARSLTKYLGSLSLTVRVMDGGVIKKIQEVGDKLDSQPEYNEAEGRRRKGSGGMMMAGLMSGGTMMALVMSAIAAMAGKALMASLLSLMLSAMGAMKGGGGGGEKSYEVVWKRCYRKITPSCLRLQLVRALEVMSSDIPLFPGISLSNNSSGPSLLPQELARSLSSEHAPLDDLVAYSLSKYLRSLTLNINLIDFVSGGNQTYQDSVVEAFSGRGTKNGLGQYGPIAAMMGGMMASMMMAALAALAGKALMTSLLALMMAAFAAMKGGGGHGESKTYEVITKPVVSHINTHSSEVQHEHGHYHHKRSLEGDRQLIFSPEEQGGEIFQNRGRSVVGESQLGYSPEEERMEVISENQNRGRRENPLAVVGAEEFERELDQGRDSLSTEHIHDIRKRSLCDDCLGHKDANSIINSPAKDSWTLQRQHPRFRREVKGNYDRHGDELLRDSKEPLEVDERFKRGVEEYRVIIDSGKINVPPHPMNIEDSIEDRLTLHVGKNNLRHFRSVGQNDYKPSKMYYVNPDGKNRKHTFLGQPRHNYRKYERSA